MGLVGIEPTPQLPAGMDHIVCCHYTTGPGYDSYCILASFEAPPLGLTGLPPLALRHVGWKTERGRRTRHSG
jgi:hypothetical protein